MIEKGLLDITAQHMSSEVTKQPMNLLSLGQTITLAVGKTQDDTVTNITTSIYCFSYSEKGDAPFQPAEI